VPGPRRSPPAGVPRAPPPCNHAPATPGPLRARSATRGRTRARSCPTARRAPRARALRNDVTTRCLSTPHPTIRPCDELRPPSNHESGREGRHRFACRGVAGPTGARQRFACELCRLRGEGPVFACSAAETRLHATRRTTKAPTSGAFARCAEEDSNLHPVIPDQALNLARLPIPPSARVRPQYSPGGGSRLRPS
jgi:hypothetical protein